jgi:hypothetical protein
MTTEQLRIALGELNGERDCTFMFLGLPEHESHLTVPRAMLIPDEPDHLVKLTDGKNVFIVDAPQVAWVRISLRKIE